MRLPRNESWASATELFLTTLSYPNGTNWYLKHLVPLGWFKGAYWPTHNPKSWGLYFRVAYQSFWKFALASKSAKFNCSSLHFAGSVEVISVYLSTSLGLPQREYLLVMTEVMENAIISGPYSYRFLWLIRYYFFYLIKIIDIKYIQSKSKTKVFNLLKKWRSRILVWITFAPSSRFYRYFQKYTSCVILMYTSYSSEQDIHNLKFRKRPRVNILQFASVHAMYWGTGTNKNSNTTKNNNITKF